MVVREWIHPGSPVRWPSLVLRPQASSRAPEDDFLNPLDEWMGQATRPWEPVWQQAAAGAHPGSPADGLLESVLSRSHWQDERGDLRKTRACEVRHKSLLQA